MTAFIIVEQWQGATIRGEVGRYEGGKVVYRLWQGRYKERNLVVAVWEGQGKGMRWRKGLGGFFFFSFFNMEKLLRIIPLFHDFPIIISTID